MSNQVYANGMEVSCKVGSGKSICAFPDVCFTPPQTPATPMGVPIPYPNTGLSSDCTDGSSSVKISGQEVMLKDKSCFKKSTGDEAGSAPKKGLINSKVSGKVYFVAWSMDVKVEGENAVRHLDMTTHNHGSGANGPAPWPFQQKSALSNPNHPCVKSGDVDKVERNCPPPAKSKSRRKGAVAGPADNTSAKCCEARKCVLVPYKPKSRCSECSGKTGHHPVPVAEFSEPRKKGETRGRPLFPDYTEGTAPAMCVEGKDHDSRTRSGKIMEHGRLGSEFTKKRNDAIGEAEEYPYRTASECAAQAISEVTGCDKDCIKRQLDAAHGKLGVKSQSTLRRSPQKADVKPTKPRAKVRRSMKRRG